MNRFSFVSAALVLCAIVATVSPLPAQQPKAAPRPTEPMARIAQDILDIQNNLINARMRLQRGTVGASAGTPSGAAPATPALRCCSTNLDTMATRLGDIIATVDKLYVVYSRSEDFDGIGRIVSLRVAIKSVGDGLVAFRDSQTEARANAALQGLIRPFNEMRAAAEGLAECCPVSVR